MQPFYSSRAATTGVAALPLVLAGDAPQANDDDRLEIRFRTSFGFASLDSPLLDRLHERAEWTDSPGSEHAWGSLIRAVVSA